MTAQTAEQVIGREVEHIRCRAGRRLSRAARVLEHYRVALAHISRTSRDVETQELALDTLTVGQEMLREGEP